MVDITGIIPLTLGGIIGLAVNVVIITAVLYFANRFIAHETSGKQSLIMAVVAYLVAPLVLSLVGISIPFSFYIIPLIVWIALGEVLQKGDRKAKLKAAALAFVIYIILSIYLTPFIFGVIPF